MLLINGGMVMSLKKSVGYSLIVLLVTLFSFSIDFSTPALLFRFPGWYECFFCLMAAFLVNKVRKWQLTETILSIIYASFLLIGRAFFKYEWDERIPFNHGEQVFKWMIAFPGFVLVCMPIVHYIFDAVCKNGRKWVNTTETVWLDRHPLLFPFLLSFFLQMLAFAFCFPGIMIPGDNVAQLLEFSSAFVDGRAGMTTYHPVLHTFLLGCFVWGGKIVFGSETLGYALFTVFQIIIYSFCLASMLCFLKENSVSPLIRIGLMAFFNLNPMFSNMLNTTTKDVWYASFFLLFIIAIVKQLQGKGSNIWLFLTGLLCVLSRNEGIFVVLTPLLTFIFIKNNRRCGIIVSGLLIIVYSLLGTVVYPMARISPGSKREMLAIPMQTMARYIIGHYGEWTEEEETWIGTVLDIENMEEWYNPNSADSIKNVSINNGKVSLTNEEVFHFLMAWINCGLRHPMTYVDAFLELKNQFLYSTSITGITKVSPNTLTTDNSRYSFHSLLWQRDLRIEYPEKMATVRRIFEDLRTKACMLPVIRLFCISPTYTWLALLVIFFFLKQKAARVLPLTFMLVIMGMVIFVTLLDGYDFRYSFPLAFVLPFCGVCNLKLLYPVKTV